MPTREQIKAQFPQASESFLRKNATADADERAKPTPDRTRNNQQAVALLTTTDEDRLNKTEKRWLAVLRADSVNAFVGIQCLTFKIAWDCRYTPDFITVTKMGTVTAWEVKGAFVFEKALYKPRAAANKFTFVRFMLAQWKDGQWTQKLIKS